MMKTERVTGYCPKQDRKATIPVTYSIGSTFAYDYKEPYSYKCSYSKVEPVCTECPIFNSLL